ncbi:hypothetical protein M758_1G138900 [Ceratodon purpureus]|nr:hypothetical protein M758_1G138900 [Ceratodon purpureus]
MAIALPTSKVQSSKCWFLTTGSIFSALFLGQQFGKGTLKEETPTESRMESLSAEIVLCLTTMKFQQIGHTEEENDQRGW